MNFGATCQSAIMIGWWNADGSRSSSSIYTRKSYVCWNEECVSSRQHVAYVLTILGVVPLRECVNLKNLLEIRRRNVFQENKGLQKCQRRMMSIVFKSNISS